ncbi:hypothetical protein FB567DRAFT_161100 [Paraphoma chrysanthemicola]|uniref:Uncharacterized protein n=1 Tax=Paraphoma chrysanthemicola TaxID=798071 RepID=A0A8K0W3S7_9PLEO|nr:hypothetical protein FB567DRAFT_161100 [Paraphoma chrysanthemicola]
MPCKRQDPIYYGPFAAGIRLGITSWTSMDNTGSNPDLVSSSAIFCEPESSLNARRLSILLEYSLSKSVYTALPTLPANSLRISGHFKGAVIVNARKAFMSDALTSARQRLRVNLIEEEMRKGVNAFFHVGWASAFPAFAFLLYYSSDAFVVECKVELLKF